MIQKLNIKNKAESWKMEDGSTKKRGWKPDDGSRKLEVKNHFRPRTPSIGLRSSFYLLFMSILLSSCSNNTFNTDTELIDYLKDEANNYTQYKSVNGVDFTLMYRPTDLLVNQELGATVNDSTIRQLRNKYSKYLYFNLSMSKNNQELLNAKAGNRSDFGAMVNQLAFGMDSKVHLFTDSKDTLDMADFIYPRMYGMSNSTTIMFVYPRDEEKLKDAHLNFTVEDLGLYTGEVKFKIPTETLMNEPQLNFIK